MFLIVTQNGQLYTINENCDVQDCGARFQSAIAAMAFDGSTGRLLVITEDCVITQFATLDTKLFMEREVKLSFGARAADGPRDSLGRASAPTSIHAVIVGRGLVAISYSGAGIRLLDYLNDESADITPAASDLGAPYRITCLDYEKRTNCLAGMFLVRTHRQLLFFIYRVIAGVDSGHLLLIHGSLSHEADSLRLLNASWEVRELFFYYLICHLQFSVAIAEN
jgi:hypothetical protein